MLRFAIFLVPVGYRLPLSLGQAAHQQAVKVLNLVVERVDNESAKVKGEPQPEPDGGDDLSLNGCYSPKISSSFAFILSVLLLLEPR